jgi:Na+/melibiose symporter-like transporter
LTRVEEERESTTGLTPAIFVAGTLGSILVVGLVGALVAWIRGRGADTSMALAYYFVGGIVFLVGSFPTGGFSLARGRTRRRPTGGGAFAAPSMILGTLLIGVGVLIDFTHPF